MLPERRMSTAPRRQKDRHTWIGDLLDSFLNEIDSARTGDVYMSEVNPSVDIRQTDRAVMFEAELPGMKPENIDVSIENSTLILRGEKKKEIEENTSSHYRKERRYGSFQRTFTLPAEVAEDKACALYKDGVLRVSFPKKSNSTPTTKKIEVKSN